MKNIKRFEDIDMREIKHLNPKIVKFAGINFVVDDFIEDDKIIAYNLKDITFETYPDLTKVESINDKENGLVGTKMTTYTRTIIGNHSKSMS